MPARADHMFVATVHQIQRSQTQAAASFQAIASADLGVISWWDEMTATNRSCFACARKVFLSNGTWNERQWQLAVPLCNAMSTCRPPDSLLPACRAFAGTH